MIKQSKDQQLEVKKKQQERDGKPYSKPKLTVLGDIRTMTLAPTPLPESESTNGEGFREG